jgi:hypothetical protein
MIKFTKTLVDLFKVSPKGSHMAVVSYSTEPKIVFKFISPNGSYHSGTEAKRLLGLMKWQRGYTFTDKALKLVQTDLLVEQAGMRRSIPKVQFYFCFLVPFGISGNLAILAL